MESVCEVHSVGKTTCTHRLSNLFLMSSQLEPDPHPCVSPTSSLPTLHITFGVFSVDSLFIYIACLFIFYLRPALLKTLQTFQRIHPGTTCTKGRGKGDRIVEWFRCLDLSHKVLG